MPVTAGLVTASENKLIISDVTVDVTNGDPIDDDVDPVTPDADDVGDLSATAAEVTPSDVTTESRDVSTGVKTLTGDVMMADDMTSLLLLLLFALDVSCTDFVDVVMVTSLLGDVDSCTELSLLDCCVVSPTDTLVTSSLVYCSLCALSVAIVMVTSDVTVLLLRDVGDCTALLDWLVRGVGRDALLSYTLLVDSLKFSLVDNSTCGLLARTLASVVGMTKRDIIAGVVDTCTILLN